MVNKIQLSGKNFDIKKVTGSHLPALLGIFGKSKFEDYWKIVLAGLKEKEITKIDFGNFISGYQYESEALVYFNKEGKYNAKKCGYYFINSIFANGPDGLVSPDLLFQIKTRAAGSAGPLEDLRKNSQRKWLHRENITLQNIEKNILGRVPDFESNKTLCTYMNKIAKCIQELKFTHMYDYDILHTDCKLSVIVVMQKVRLL